MQVSPTIFNRILAIVFALVAIIAFAMPFISIGFANVSGFYILELCIRYIDYILDWPLSLVCFFLSGVLATFNFLFSLLSLKSRKIGTVIFSLFGIASMLFFANEIGFVYVGTGIYVYIVALFFAFIFSILGSTKRSQESSQE